MTAWKRRKRRDSGENPSAERGGGGLLRQPGRTKTAPLGGRKRTSPPWPAGWGGGPWPGPADEGKDRFLGQRTDRGKLVVGEIEHRTGVNGGNGHGYLLRVEWMLPIIKHPGGWGKCKGCQWEKKLAAGRKYAIILSIMGLALPGGRRRPGGTGRRTFQRNRGTSQWN